MLYTKWTGPYNYHQGMSLGARVPRPRFDRLDRPDKKQPTGECDMEKPHRNTGTESPARDFPCVIYETDRECRDAVLAFLQNGLRRKERCLVAVGAQSCFPTRQTLRKADAGLARAEDSGDLRVFHTERDLFGKGVGPDAALDILVSEAESLCTGDGRGLRLVCGTGAPGTREGDLWQKLGCLSPCTMLCQYDLRSTDAATLQAAILSHPRLLWKGQVLRTPRGRGTSAPDREGRTKDGLRTLLDALAREKRLRKALWDSERRTRRLLDAGLGIRSDVPQQAEAREAVRDSEDLLQRSQRIAHIGSWDYDHAADHLRWTEETYRIFGVAPGEFQENYEALQQRVHPEDLTGVMERFADSLAGRVPYDLEHRIVCPDGTEKWVHENSEHFFDSQGAPVRSIGTVQDITRRRESETRLQEKEHQHRMALEGLVDVTAAMLARRDPYTVSHQKRVSRLAVAIAAEMGLDADRTEGLQLAAKVHDIGKIMVPAEILNKPGALTDLEFTLIRQHPRAGYEILAGIQFPWPVASIVDQPTNVWTGAAIRTASGKTGSSRRLGSST